MKSNIIMWGLYALFVAAALYFNQHPTLLSLDVPLAPVKVLVWLAWIGFFIYTFYCSLRENFLRSAFKIVEYRWGIQISSDLYLGVLLALLVIFLHEGPVALLLWLVPAIVFANLAILPYFAIHFDSIVSHLLG